MRAPAPEPSAPRAGAADRGPAAGRPRHPLASYAIAIPVGVAAAGFAHLFVQAGERVLAAVFGHGKPAEAALATPRLVVALVVALAVAVSAGLARRSSRFGNGRTGLGHVSVALDGDPADAGTVRPSLRATLVRGLGTFASSVGLTSIGRESAMIETGGALGASLGQRLRVGPWLAVAGVSAAFTGAYTAPLGALAYCDNHLRLRNNRRAVGHAVVGAGAGLASAHLLWERHTVLPHPTGATGAWWVLALVVALPAALAARALFELRRRAERALPPLGSARWIACVLVAAAAVGVARAAAGNGMNALSLTAAEPVLWAAVGLAVFRVAGMLAALAAGVPGGVILPTMAITAGWGLLTMLAVEWVGYDLPGTHWDGMILAAAAGVAIGLRAPLLAVVLVPEMVGDYSLLPAAAFVVLLAVGVDRGVDAAASALRSRAGGRVRGSRLGTRRFGAPLPAPRA